jgi:hypothetical protein
MGTPTEHMWTCGHDREERVIAVYGHGDFFHCFLREHMGIKGKWMHNCEVVGGRIRR